jgi:hypothetical protein
VLLDGPVTNQYASPSLSNYPKGTPGESLGRKATGPRALRCRRGGAAKPKTAELRKVSKAVSLFLEGLCSA